MADRVKPHHERVQPCISFYLDYPILFSLASKPSLYRKWKKIQDENGISIKHKMSRWFLDLFEVTTWQLWRKKNKIASVKLNKEFKDVFNDILGLDEKTLSKLAQEMMEKEVEEYENK